MTRFVQESAQEVMDRILETKKDIKRIYMDLEAGVTVVILVSGHKGVVRKAKTEEYDYPSLAIMLAYYRASEKYVKWAINHNTKLRHEAVRKAEEAHAPTKTYEGTVGLRRTEGRH